MMMILGEKEAMVMFHGEKEAMVKFPREKEVMVKFPREKEVILINEDSYPPIALINTTAFDIKAVMNSKKARGIPPSLRIRKVLIHKQYLTYKMI